MRPSLLLLLFIPVLSWAKIVTYTYATLSNVVISFDPATGDSEHRLVIPPDYPSYTLTYTCSYDEGSYTLDVEVPDDPPPEEEVEHEDGEGEGEGEEEVKFETSITWSVKGSGAIIDGSATEEVVTIRFSEGNTEDVELKVVVTVECTAGNGVGTEESSTFIIYSPVWDTGSPISAHLEGTTMSPDSRRSIPINGSLTVTVSLGSSGEQDRRESYTITTPWDSIVHTGGSSGGGEYGIAAAGGIAMPDAEETGESSETGSPYWVASAGSFPESNVGESVTWKAPEAPHKGIVIRAMVDDLAQKPENEAGSADDTATEAGRVQVDVVKPSLEKLLSYVKVNDDDDDGNGTADKDDTGPVSNEDDLRAAFTLAFEPSGIEDGVLVLSDKSDTPRIRIWMADTVGTKQKITLPKEWSMSEFDSLQDKTLYVEGLQPSLNADDVTLEFKYTGGGSTITSEASLIVVRLDLDADANYDGQWTIADEYLEDNSGVIVLLNNDDDDNDKLIDKDANGNVENEDDLQKITLSFSPASLSGATLKLEASAGNENIKIWTAPDKSGEPVTLPQTFRPGSASAGDGEDSAPPLPSTLHVEGITEGEATLKLSFVNDDAIFDEMTLHVVKIGLLPDFNRDRKIDDGDQTKLIAKGPFRFWVNDDEDDGDVADDDSDIPSGNDPNHNDNQVNGRSDLLDFFPVWVNVEKLIEKQPPDITFQFCLRQDDSALKIVYTTLSPGNAGAFLTTPCANCGPTLGQSANAATTTVLGTSAIFPDCFVDELEKGNGVVMAEGAAASSSPLVLEIRNGDHVAFARKMPMKLSGVEEMFRWLNLRNCTGGSVNKVSSMGVPVNNPDDPEFGKYFIFLHGYSVNEEAARAWNSEVFKRLQQSGSRARYVAVAWYGNESQIWGWIPFELGGKTPDYYSNVEHAFATALPLKNALDNLGNDRVVAAHSLGNVVVSSAIKDHGLSVSTYLMLNAAVAGEAYTGNHDAVNVMRHPDWNDYDTRLWASYWHELFQDTDGRYDLTWKKRFDGVTGINYYSSQEDVLKNGVGTLPDISVTDPTRAWVNQEMRKGTELLWITPGNAEGGWGFDTYYLINEGDTYRIRHPAETTEITNEQLKNNSFFYRFDDSELYTVDGDAFSRQPAIRNRLLADAIPALSHATGSTYMNGGTDMVGFKNGLFDWPFRKDGYFWLHSDLKMVAYPLTHALFDEIVTNRGLK